MSKLTVHINEQFQTLFKMQFKFNERIGLMSDLYRDNVNIILTKTIKHINNLENEDIPILTAKAHS